MKNSFKAVQAGNVAIIKELVKDVYGFRTEPDLKEDGTAKRNGKGSGFRTKTILDEKGSLIMAHVKKITSDTRKAIKVLETGTEAKLQALISQLELKQAKPVESSKLEKEAKELLADIG